MKPAADRRIVLSALLFAPVSQVLGAGWARAQANDLGSIVQPAEKTKAAFLARARALRDQAVREGDQAYGAIVVCDGIVVGEGRNYVVLHHDPTAHAELLAVRMRRGDSRGVIFPTVMCTQRQRPAPCARARCIGRASDATTTRARRKGVSLLSSLVSHASSVISFGI